MKCGDTVRSIMAKANIKVLFSCELSKLWDIVTDNTNYAWRSDLSRIEIADEKTFVEYTKDGFATTFKITHFEPCRRYEFDMENKNMKGHWTGVFTEVPGGVEIDFTEDITVNNPVMKLLAGQYLRSQQKKYVKDLQRALQFQKS